jgi:phage shock protein C
MEYDATRRVQRLYRNPRHGELMGVCAGVADYFGGNVALIRILAIIALLWFNALALAVYLILGFMLPTRPDTLYDRDTDEEYRCSMRRSADGTFRDVRDRCRELDMKLRHMEGYVTSSRYDLDRQFRDLEH